MALADCQGGIWKSNGGSSSIASKVGLPALFPNYVKCYFSNPYYSSYAVFTLNAFSSTVVYVNSSGSMYFQYAMDGSYSAQSNASGYDCLGKSIQTLTAEGNAFN